MTEEGSVEVILNGYWVRVWSSDKRFRPGGVLLRSRIQRAIVKIAGDGNENGNEKRESWHSARVRVEAET